MEASITISDGTTLRVRANPNSPLAEVAILHKCKGPGGSGAGYDSAVHVHKDRLYRWLTLAMSTLDDCGEEKGEDKQPLTPVESRFVHDSWDG